MGTERKREDSPEITPEMIEAGQDMLDHLLDRSLAPGEGLGAIPDGWAEAVFRAMLERRRYQIAEGR
jgi:hypothetical protein